MDQPNSRIEPLPDFKLGDVVILKSGGPSMTVTEVRDSTVRAQWFDDNKQVQSHYFRCESLKQSSKL